MSSSARGSLRISLRKGQDLTGKVPRPFPEVLIEGDPAGLRALARMLEHVISEARRDPDYHTHVTGKDPGAATDPPELMLTIQVAPAADLP